jgi:hypothetical protein
MAASIATNQPSVAKHQTFLAIVTTDYRKIVALDLVAAYGVKPVGAEN